MIVVKVDAISSTNAFLKEYIKTHSEKKMYCISAFHQTTGKGQRGTIWSTEAGKNLTFSVYLPGIRNIHQNTFKLSALVALALTKVLERHDIPKLSIKWPNDILSRQYKIGGILIENMMTQNKDGASIIGIGLNVNQTYFPEVPKASSLKSIMNASFNLDELLNEILIEMESIPNQFNTLSYSDVIKDYYKRLFKYKAVSMFQFPNGQLLQGLLRGVDEYGKLIVEFDNDRVANFDIKEIKMIY
ncbi:biotin--[acetyl-CoA-carboxylase] ligase [Psychroflexus tropicus]|uniref:biotin--[acetyl-CoA-carboxylase] ligase n=1 Tax=Psychroflexus tropicus TaxID=197345 RepID=UPI0003AAFE8C|nr:biotin--[acetyl-CoA-carboxylase] ligase [Psychroflexus tropicus]